MEVLWAEISDANPVWDEYIKQRNAIEKLMGKE
jgi:hypothetical protein